MTLAATYRPAGWERILRVPAIGYRLRPWGIGTQPSLLCMAAALAVCAALLLAPLLCVAHCLLLGSSAAPHAHEHGAHAAPSPFHCQQHADQPQQPAQQPSAPLPRAVYELLPLTTPPLAAAVLLVRALPLPGGAFAPQNIPAPPERPPIG